ncbi:hypothetical protein [Actinocatenispora rupis]|uniref:PH domain-containing protein n=1 Tax=Actinocatenispora rupis TaxID=519421 RepID=A0A8J3NA44_9ACTN|nr:hypothetical protein [Actinocatenispora rupis]GID09142.1 hypothetical protein Aru02nite_00310 [Actinocatenispora rupis]
MTTTYRLRASGVVGVLLPVLVGVFVGAVGLDAVLRAGGPLAWTLLVFGVVWALAWLRLPWAVRLDPDARTVTFLGPLRRTTMAADAIGAVAGRWTGGTNRWFLATVWIQPADRVLGFPFPVGYPDPDQVREELLALNPTIRTDT